MIESDPVTLFDRRALEYDAMYEEDTSSGDWLRARLQAVLDLVGEGPGTILDIGAGSGRLVLELERRGWTVWGVDGAPAMLALAHARASTPADRLLEARAERLPFDAETFDAVSSTGVLSWAPDKAAIVAEVARVLRPGGRAVVTVGNARSPFVRWRHDVVYPLARAVKGRVQVGQPAPPLRSRLPGRKDLVAMLERGGLELERMEYACCTVVPDPLDRVFPRSAASLARRANRLPYRPRSVLAGQRVLALRKGPQPR